MPATRKNAVRGKAAVPAARPPRRLKREDRERQIVDEAIRYFADVGFSSDTRELARRLHSTQPLLLRYFPSKEGLIERVFQELSTSRWNPFWEEMLADRSQPLRERLPAVDKDYSRIILTREWVHGAKVPDDIDAVIENDVTSFLEGGPAFIRKLHSK